MTKIPQKMLLVILCVVLVMAFSSCSSTPPEDLRLAYIALQDTDPLHCTVVTTLSDGADTSTDTHEYYKFGEDSLRIEGTSSKSVFFTTAEGKYYTPLYGEAPLTKIDREMELRPVWLQGKWTWDYLSSIFKSYEETEDGCTATFSHESSNIVFKIVEGKIVTIQVTSSGEMTLHDGTKTQINSDMLYTIHDITEETAKKLFDGYHAQIQSVS